MLGWSLLIGSPFMVFLVVAGAGAFLGLLLRRGRVWWTTSVPVAVGLTGLSVFLIYGILTWWWQPFPDPLPPLVWAAIVLGFGGIWLAVARAVTAPRRWWAALGHLALMMVVVVACGELANVEFGEYPTVRDALGLPPLDETSLASTPAVAKLVRLPATGSLARVWDPPRSMPRAGVVSQVDIPGRVSGFAARPAWVYLPPAYLSWPRAQLPVLVLVSGQPGAPANWLHGGVLAARMDRFAAAHHGLAPVVVMADDLTSPTINPMCIDSRLGNAYTYLTRDVPAWIDSHLQVNEDPRTWAFGGFSNGGTCAVQMGVTAPKRYPTFVDISGENQPRTGSPTKTLRDAFGADGSAAEAEFRAINPIDILATHRFPKVAGQFVVGADDSRYRPQAQQMYAATRAAGMRVGLHLLPGGHSWAVWGPALTTVLPWLGSRMRLTG